jgi:hypothetical protein
LRDHLGARFVTVDEGATAVDLDLQGGPRPDGLAKRLAEAVTIGSVTDLEALAQELMNGGADQAALGRRISRLAGSFDFDGLRALSDALAPEDRGSAAD